MVEDIRRTDWMDLEPTVRGWGINDVNYIVRVYRELPPKGGKRSKRLVWSCGYYEHWQRMLQRCYSETCQATRPNYIGCSVDINWKYLSNFIEWTDSQPNRDWEKCSLDKDLLSLQGNYYSPETAVYIPQNINSFVIPQTKNRGDFMIGVSWNKASRNKPYQSQCNNPFTKRVQYLKCFATELEAHKAWQAKKHEYACMLADLQPDLRVAEALCQRYSPDKDWTKR